MKKWKRVCSFANGTVYASGEYRKLVLPEHPDIFFKLDTKQISWKPGAVNSKSARQDKATRHE